MWQSKIIFIGGVHGVGKTSFARNFSIKFDFPHYSASELIFPEVREDLGEKVVLSPDANQEILLAKLSHLTSVHSSFLLDGHFTLLTPDGVTPIATGHFRDMGLCHLVLLVDSSRAIHQRQKKRDGKEISIDTVIEHQDAEKAHFFQVGKELNLPTTTIDLGLHKSVNVMSDLLSNVVSLSNPRFSS